MTGGGSTWSNGGGVNIGNLGTGTLTIADGGVVNGPIVIAATAVSGGTLNIGAGASAPAVAPGTVNAPSVAFGAGKGTLNFNHTSANYVFAPAIIGTGQLTTVNVLAGTTTLTGANSYGGTTNVNAGTLRAGATNTFSSNSAVTVASGGTLDLAGFDQTIPGLINHGIVRTGGSPGTGPGTVLTVAGNYTAGSTLALNTFLAGDGSPSDRLVINAGTATGSTGIVVTNTGGPGAVTASDGILVVDTTNGGTTAPGAFALGAPVVAGPFEYTLERGSIAGGNGEAWFLRSALDCALVPTNPNCVGPTPPAPPPASPTPNIRPEVSLYMAMPVAAAITGRQTIDTLHERMGGNAQALGPGDNGTYNGTPDGAWARVLGLWGNRDTEPGGIFGVGNNFDYAFGGLQAGLDLYRAEGQDGSRDNAGLYLAFGHSEVDVEHNLRGHIIDGGQDDLDAYSLGGYWTHFGPNDWYLDGVLQGTYYNTELDGQRGLPTAETDGWGLAASLEGGYPFQLGGGWLIEPQAQLVYQGFNFDDFDGVNTNVSYSDLDSLAGRIGLRLAGSWNLEEAQGADLGVAPPPGEIRQASLWLRGDIWHEFLGDPVTAFTGPGGSTFPFTADLEDSWWEFGLGGSWDFTSSATVYANVDYQRAFEGEADAWKGNLGVKVAW